MTSARRRLRPATALGLALGLTLGLGATGCSSAGGRATPTTEAGTATSRVSEVTRATVRQTSTTAISVVTVPGSPRQTTSVPGGLGPGQARITGTVVGPSGPVSGAVVRIERLAGGAAGSTDLTSGQGGGFVLASVLGGSYRVRAWKSPDLAQVQARSFFLAADESRNLELKVDRFGNVNVRVKADPEPLPPVDPFTLTVLVYTGTVAPGGELLATPRPGLVVQVVPAGDLVLVGANQATTDANGVVTFRLRCSDGGPADGEVVASGGRFPLGLDTCPAPPPPPSTTTTPP